MQETLAEVLSEHGVRQLHVAETEKYAHVTYFFNGGRERSGRGRPGSSCLRRATSPSYDQKPEMSARELTDRFVEELDRDGYRLRCHQPGQSGHGRPHRIHPRRGESSRDSRRVPRRRSSRRSSRNGGVSLITADHGNAEQMLEADGSSPHTAHTTNPVPLIVTDPEVTLTDTGELADLSPLCWGFWVSDNPYR